jgi:hypothetical protein
MFCSPSFPNEGVMVLASVMQSVDENQRLVTSGICIVKNDNPRSPRRKQRVTLRVQQMIRD